MDNDIFIDFGEIVIENIPEKVDKATRIMSFNVRCADDPEGSIANRSRIAVAVIRQYAPDSFGVQEANGRWMKILHKELDEKYGCVGLPRGENPEDETSAVFYLKEKYELLDSGTIWLSETPHIPFTKHKDSRNIRIATWATLKSKNDGRIHTHINTHLDHISDEARALQGRVLNQKINELSVNGGPVICTGDFNTDKNGTVYKEMLLNADDARLVAEKTDAGITYHNYGKIVDKYDGAIDFVFVPEGTSVETYKIIRDTAKGMYPSDHYPIIADINL